MQSHVQNIIYEGQAIQGKLGQYEIWRGGYSIMKINEAEFWSRGQRIVKRCWQHCPLGLAEHIRTRIIQKRP